MLTITLFIFGFVLASANGQSYTAGYQPGPFNPTNYFTQAGFASYFANDYHVGVYGQLIRNGIQRASTYPLPKATSDVSLGGNCCSNLANSCSSGRFYATNGITVNTTHQFYIRLPNPESVCVVSDMPSGWNCDVWRDDNHFAFSALHFVYPIVWGNTGATVTVQILVGPGLEFDDDTAWNSTGYVYSPIHQFITVGQRTLTSNVRFGSSRTLKLTQTNDFKEHFNPYNSWLTLRIGADTNVQLGYPNDPCKNRTFTAVQPGPGWDTYPYMGRMNLFYTR